MLKKRIKKWDIGRSHRHADMLYALRIATGRELQRKSTTFLIRGRYVTYPEIKNYFRRKGIRDLISLVDEADAASPTTRIECHTPMPEDAARHSSNSKLILQTEICRVSAPNLLTPNHIYRALPQSKPLNQLDQLLRLGRVHFDSVFEQESWRDSRAKFELGALESFYHAAFDGQAFLEQDRLGEAFKHFNLAFDLIRNILIKETLLFLPYLYHMLLPDRSFQRQEVFIQLLAFIQRMAKMSFPQSKPIQQSLAILLALTVEERGQCCIRVFQSLIEDLQFQFKDSIPDQLELYSTSLCS